MVFRCTLIQIDVGWGNEPSVHTLYRQGEGAWIKWAGIYDVVYTSQEIIYPQLQCLQTIIASSSRVSAYLFNL